MSRNRSLARDERRAMLLGAARQVFSEKGYHAATVDDITRAAGVAKGTFYLYFEEKREVFYEIIRSFLQLVTDISRSVGDPDLAPGDFLARAEKGAHLLMRVYLENREMVRLVYRESMGLDRDLEGMVRTFYRDIARMGAEKIQRGIELGLFRPVDPLLYAYAHIGMVERVLLALLDEENQLPAPDEVVRQLIAAVFTGLDRR